MLLTPHTQSEVCNLALFEEFTTLPHEALDT